MRRTAAAAVLKAQMAFDAMAKADRPVSPTARGRNATPTRQLSEHEAAAL